MANKKPVVLMLSKAERTKALDLVRTAHIKIKNNEKFYICHCFPYFDDLGIVLRRAVMQCLQRNGEQFNNFESYYRVKDANKFRLQFLSAWIKILERSLA